MTLGIECFKEHLFQFKDSDPDFVLELHKCSVDIYEYFSDHSRRSFKEFVNFVRDNQNEEIVQKFITNMIKSCSIWIGPEFFAQLPIFLPYSIRDRTSWQTRQINTNEDNWGAANDKGYVIDDNSDIKDYIRNALVYNGMLLNNKKPRTGFVACHIWPETTGNPRVYSFIPNIVWLPKPIARLSDDQSTFLSNWLKICSLKLYHNIRFNSEKMNKIVEKSWSLLIRDTNSSYKAEEISSKDFSFSKQNINRRKSALIRNIEKIIKYINIFNLNPNYMIKAKEKLIHTRYLPSLRLLIERNPSATDEYVDWLNSYLEALQ